jgi:hypothetical protein
MSRINAAAICAFMVIACAASCTAQSQPSQSGQSGEPSQQSGQSEPPPAQPQADNSASANQPNLTPLQTVQYLNQKIVDEVRIPAGMDTGASTVWPGFFAIEPNKGTLWWVRGAQTSSSGWEIRFSSAQVDQLDPDFLALGMGHGNYEKISIKCKANPDASMGNPCWHDWVASWDDQSPTLSAGHFGDVKVAHAADHDDQQILDGHDFSVSPLGKQILLFDGHQRQLIDVDPTKPFSELEIYLGAADSDTAQRMFRALKYLLKTMPAAVTENDPFGP